MVSLQYSAQYSQTLISRVFVPGATWIHSMLSDPISVRFILILSSLRIGLSNACFLQYFPPKPFMYFCCPPYVPIAFAIYIRSQPKESNEQGNVEPSAWGLGWRSC
jgi:hypothetical protein